MSLDSSNPLTVPSFCLLLDPAGLESMTWEACTVGRWVGPEEDSIHDCLQERSSLEAQGHRTEVADHKEVADHIAVEKEVRRERADHMPPDCILLEGRMAGDLTCWVAVALCEVKYDDDGWQKQQNLETTTAHSCSGNCSLTHEDWNVLSS